MPESSGQIDNRETFLARLDEFVDAHQRADTKFALLVIDINQFRRFNIAQGLNCADRLLTAFAEALHEIARPQDYLARIGNAEFAMLLPEIRNGGHASLAAIKIGEMLKNPIDLGDSLHRVTSNIGIAVFPDHADHGERLFSHAQQALTDSRNGLQCYALFADEDAAADSIDWDIDAELQKAIEKDQFELYFQPQVHLSGHRIFGAEALIRWRHESQGFIRPDIFIPVAEESGQIIEITQWTLNSALWFVKSWPASMAGFKVAVNVSTRMLAEPDFTEMVCNAMRIYDVPQDQLTLEITESALLDDMSASVAVLDELKTLGVNISIDDFGTGYSSLAYFKNIPANELKIDQSFIRHMLENRMDQHIVETIIRMARGFGLSVVAEGIEDEATLDGLRRRGCDIAQGYHIARPMPREAFLEWVEAYLAVEARAGAAGSGAS